MITPSTSLTLTLTGLLVILGLGAGCGEGHQGNPDGSLDGDVNPDGLKKLEFTNRDVGEFLADLALNATETEVVGCSIRGEVIFYDAETLEETGRVPLGDEPMRPNGYCRMKRIGDWFFAYYGNSDSLEVSPARMVMGKVSSAHELEAVWEFPSHRDPTSPYNENSFGTTGRNFSGLSPSADGQTAIFALGAARFYDRFEQDQAGTEVPWLDLESGELTMDRTLDLPGTTGSYLHLAFDGHRVINSYMFYDGSRWVHTVLDLDTRESISLEPELDFFGWVDVDEGFRTLIGGASMSSPWWVRDLDTWEVLGTKENLYSGWSEDGVALSRTRAAVTYAFNDPPSILVLVDIASGRGLASAWIPEEALQCAVRTADSRQVFAGGLDTLSRVEIPEELLE